MDFIDIAPLGLYNQNVVGENCGFSTIIRENILQTETVSNMATVILSLTTNKKSHIVDLLLVSSLGAFICALLSRTYICVSCYIWVS